MPFNYTELIFSNHFEVAESSLYFPFYSVSKPFYIGRVQPSFLQDTAILRVVGFLRTIALTDQNSILLASIWKLSEILYICISFKVYVGAGCPLRIRNSFMRNVSGECIEPMSTTSPTPVANNNSTLYAENKSPHYNFS